MALVSATGETFSLQGENKPENMWEKEHDVTCMIAVHQFNFDLKNISLLLIGQHGWNGWFWNLSLFSFLVLVLRVSLSKDNWLDGTLMFLDEDCCNYWIILVKNFIIICIIYFGELREDIFCRSVRSCSHFTCSPSINAAFSTYFWAMCVIWQKRKGAECVWYRQAWM